MKPTWLIQNYSQEEFDKIKSALEVTNTPFQEVIYQSITDIIDINSLPKNDKCVVIYGSIQFAKALAKLGLTYTPGAYGFSNYTDCSYYMSKIPSDYLLNYPYVITTWLELKRSKNFYETTFKQIFVRPNSGNKVFTGQIIFCDEWEDRIKLIEETSSVMDETLVVVSAAKSLDTKEYRFVIIDKKVITGTMYNWDKSSSSEFPKEAQELAQKIADLYWQLDTAYTCDIVITKRGPKVIELNSFSCAGLYSTDRIKIINAINEEALKEHRDMYVS